MSAIVWFLAAFNFGQCWQEYFTTRSVDRVTLIAGLLALTVSVFVSVSERK